MKFRYLQDDGIYLPLTNFYYTLILVPLGIAVALVGVLIGIAGGGSTESAGLMLLICFNGLILFAIGLSLYMQLKQNEKMRAELRRSGTSFWLPVAEVYYNEKVKIHGQHPYVVRCYPQDATGLYHEMHSRNIRFDPTGRLPHNYVKVYMEPGRYDRYDIAVDESLDAEGPKFGQEKPESSPWEP